MECRVWSDFVLWQGRWGGLGGRFAAQGEPRYLQTNPERAAAIADGCTIWSPRWQLGAFAAMPAFIERELRA